MKKKFCTFAANKDLFNPINAFRILPPKERRKMMLIACVVSAVIGALAVAIAPFTATLFFCLSGISGGYVIKTAADKEATR